MNKRIALVGAAVAVLGVSLTPGCRRENPPPPEGNYFTVRTIETLVDPTFGDFTSEVSVNVQGAFLAPLPPPPGEQVTGTVTFFQHFTNFNGIYHVANPKLPATWRFWWLTGACDREQPWDIGITKKRDTTVTLQCVIYRRIVISSFDEYGTPYDTCCYSDTMTAGQALYLNQRLTSADGRFALVYQGDGNLVLYDANWSDIWSSNTYGATYGQAVMQDDGNFVVYDGGGAAVWSSGTWGNPGAWLTAQNDGNLVIYSASNVPLWSSGTCCR